MKAHSNNDRKSKYNLCEYCGAPIPTTSEDSFCDACREYVLFQQVREYIRENDVNEFQVSSYFNIPLRVIKQWIKEGRIEYKTLEDGKRTINSRMRCERCGAPVTFGVLCPKCLQLLNKNVSGYNVQSLDNDDRMFFLNNNDKK